jgi:hypothetical protein
VPFLSQVAIRRVGLNTWQLLEPLCYREGEAGLTFTAPAGFRTDFATVPRWAQGLVPRTGLWDEPAVIHDLCCDDLRRYRDECARWACAEGRATVRAPWRNARQTDLLWHQMLRAGGVGPVLAALLWTAVRWGALANPARRPGWWRDAPTVLAVTAGTLAVLAGTVRLCDAALHALIGS